MKKYFKIIAMFMFLAFSTVLLSSCSLLDFLFTPSEGSTYTTPIETNATLTERERLIQIAETHVEAVVTVFVVETATDTDIAFGSGVAVAENGYIVTNYHVVDSAILYPGQYVLEVYLNEETTPYSAEVLWSHTTLDMAIIKCEYENIPFVSMMDRTILANEEDELKALEAVIAIGTPIDFSLQNTITTGEVSSATERLSTSGSVLYENLIQHTAPINHGNSGGALFDSYGRLIGLNTLGHDDANSLFFAVPIYPITVILDRVIEAYDNNQTFSYGLMGVTAFDRYEAMYMESQTFDDSGMYVESVSGASVGKLQVGDVITGITINSVDYQVDIRNDLIFALMQTSAGDTITIKYNRGLLIDRTVNITVL